MPGDTPTPTPKPTENRESGTSPSSVGDIKLQFSPSPTVEPVPTADQVQADLVKQNQQIQTDLVKKAPTKADENGLETRDGADSEKYDPYNTEMEVKDIGTAMKKAFLNLFIAASNINKKYMDSLKKEKAALIAKPKDNPIMQQKFLNRIDNEIKAREALTRLSAGKSLNTKEDMKTVLLNDHKFLGATINLLRRKGTFADVKEAFWADHQILEAGADKAKLWFSKKTNKKSNNDPGDVSDAQASNAPPDPNTPTAKVTAAAPQPTAPNPSTPSQAAAATPNNFSPHLDELKIKLGSASTALANAARSPANEAKANTTFSPVTLLRKMFSGSRSASIDQTFYDVMNASDNNPQNQANPAPTGTAQNAPSGGKSKGLKK